MAPHEAIYDLTLGLDESAVDCASVPTAPGFDEGPEGPDASLPPRVRIETLLQRMRPCRDMLLNVMRACARPVPVAEVNGLLVRMQQNNRSVFTAADLCALLQRAGALRLVNADCTPYDQDREPVEAVEEGGAPALEAGEPATAYWMSTEEALGVADGDDPLGRLRELFERDALYLPIYKAILGLCARGEGAKTLALGAAVDGDPLMQSPRRFATSFVDGLERCGALEWRGAWFTTDVGLHGLDDLLDVAPAEVPEGFDLVRESPYAAYDDFGPLEG